MQNIVYEVAHFEDVSLGKGVQEMVGQIALTTGSAKKYRRGLLQGADKDGSFGADNFGTYVVGINGLLGGLDGADCPTSGLEIDDAADDVAILSNLRPNGAGGVGVHLGNFVAH